MTKVPKYLDQSAIPRPTAWEELPYNCDLFHLSDFMQRCEEQLFVDTGGDAYYAVGERMSNVGLYPSDAGDANFQPPSWATHVAWVYK